MQSGQDPGLREKRAKVRPAEASGPRDQAACGEQGEVSSGPPRKAGGPSTSGGGGVGQYKRVQPREAGRLGKCGSAYRGRGVAEQVSMSLAEKEMAKTGRTG